MKILWGVIIALAMGASAGLIIHANTPPPEPGLVGSVLQLPGDSALVQMGDNQISMREVRLAAGTHCVVAVSRYASIPAISCDFRIQENVGTER